MMHFIETNYVSVIENATKFSKINQYLFNNIRKSDNSEKQVPAIIIINHYHLPHQLSYVNVVATTNRIMWTSPHHPFLLLLLIALIASTRKEFWQT
jgi:hypothetical protein